MPKVIVTFDYLIKYTADKKTPCFKLPRYICDLLHLIVYYSFCYSQINLKLFLIFNFKYQVIEEIVADLKQNEIQAA